MDVCGVMRTGAGDPRLKLMDVFFFLFLGVGGCLSFIFVKSNLFNSWTFDFCYRNEFVEKFSFLLNEV